MNLRVKGPHFALTLAQKFSSTITKTFRSCFVFPLSSGMGPTSCLLPKHGDFLFTYLSALLILKPFFWKASCLAHYITITSQMLATEETQYILDKFTN